MPSLLGLLVCIYIFSAVFGSHLGQHRAPLCSAAYILWLSYQPCQETAEMPSSGTVRNYGICNQNSGKFITFLPPADLPCFHHHGVPVYLRAAMPGEVEPVWSLQPTPEDMSTLASLRREDAKTPSGGDGASSQKMNKIFIQEGIINLTNLVSDSELSAGEKRAEWGACSNGHGLDL